MVRTSLSPLQIITLLLWVNKLFIVFFFMTKTASISSILYKSHKVLSVLFKLWLYKQLQTQTLAEVADSTKKGIITNGSIKTLTFDYALNQSAFRCLDII